MKFRYTFECMDMGDETIAVPVGDNANDLHGVVKLNKEGLEIFKLLQDNKTEEEIVSILANEYSNDKQQLTDYVHKTIQSMIEAQLLEE
ncbi:PqqD family protein [Aristaeella lactis]|uniref:Coenzyme PQQ synthesis protein D (PqqD) n=1 Tax=Aristaeella lactis TaxID=3046383 RepID=A0AC61PJ33_9FIRM|nr:PqqD family protein [Aristaeella lactis]QUA54026.1 PqqD family protein [Aristaeella lactis]SMC42488.1 Coenzyme PQQ synthesis protein D (PqqD) [Aristaeella lactis]